MLIVAWTVDNAPSGNLLRSPIRERRTGLERGLSGSRPEMPRSTGMKSTLPDAQDPRRPADRRFSAHEHEASEVIPFVPFIRREEWHFSRYNPNVDMPPSVVAPVVEVGLDPTVIPTHPIMVHNLSYADPARAR